MIMFILGIFLIVILLFVLMAVRISNESNIKNKKKSKH